MPGRKKTKQHSSVCATPSSSSPLPLLPLPQSSELSETPSKKRKETRKKTSVGLPLRKSARLNPPTSNKSKDTEEKMPREDNTSPIPSTSTSTSTSTTSTSSRPNEQRGDVDVAEENGGHHNHISLEDAVDVDLPSLDSSRGTADTLRNSTTDSSSSSQSVQFPQLINLHTSTDMTPRSKRSALSKQYDSVAHYPSLIFEDIDDDVKIVMNPPPPPQPSQNQNRDSGDGEGVKGHTAKQKELDAVFKNLQEDVEMCESLTGLDLNKSFPPDKESDFKKYEVVPMSTLLQRQVALTFKVPPSIPKKELLWAILRKLYSINPKKEREGLKIIHKISKGSELSLKDIYDECPNFVSYLVNRAAVYDSCANRQLLEEKYSFPWISSNSSFLKATVSAEIIRNLMCECINWAFYLQVTPERQGFQLQPGTIHQHSYNRPIVDNLMKQKVGNEMDLLVQRSQLKYSDKDVNSVGQRVQAIAAILKNFSVSNSNALIMEVNPALRRFVLILMHCSWGEIRELGWDILKNLVKSWSLKDSINDMHSALLYSILSQSMESESRFIILRTMQVIRGLVSLSLSDVCLGIKNTTRRQLLTGKSKQRVYNNIILLWRNIKLCTLLPRLFQLITLPDEELLETCLICIRNLVTCWSKLGEKVGSNPYMVGLLINLLFARETDFGKPLQSIFQIREYLSNCQIVLHNAKTRTEVPTPIEMSLNTLLHRLSADITLRLSSSDEEFIIGLREYFPRVRIPCQVAELQQERTNARTDDAAGSCSTSRYATKAFKNYRDHHHAAKGSATKKAQKKCRTDADGGDSTSKNATKTFQSSGIDTDSASNDSTSTFHHSDAEGSTITTSNQPQDICKCLKLFIVTNSEVEHNTAFKVTMDESFKNPEEDSSSDCENSCQQRTTPKETTRTCTTTGNTKGCAESSQKIKGSVITFILDKVTQNEQKRNEQGAKSKGKTRSRRKKRSGLKTPTTPTPTPTPTPSHSTSTSKSPFKLNVHYKPEEFIKFDPAQISRVSCNWCVNSTTFEHSSDEESQTLYKTFKQHADIWTAECSFVHDHVQSLYEYDPKSRFDFYEMYKVYRETRLKIGPPILIFCFCWFLDCVNGSIIANNDKHQLEQEKVVVEGRQLIYLKGVLLKKDLEELEPFIQHPVLKTQKVNPNFGCGGEGKRSRSKSPKPCSSKGGGGGEDFWELASTPEIIDEDGNPVLVVVDDVTFSPIDAEKDLNTLNTLRDRRKATKSKIFISCKDGGGGGGGIDSLEEGNRCERCGKREGAREVLRGDRLIPNLLCDLGNFNSQPFTFRSTHHSNAGSNSKAAFAFKSTCHSKAHPEASFTSQSTKQSEARFNFQSIYHSEAPFTFQSTHHSEAHPEAPFASQSTNHSETCPEAHPEAPFASQSTNHSEACPEAPFASQSTHHSEAHPEAPFASQSTNHSEACPEAHPEAPFASQSTHHSEAGPEAPFASQSTNSSEAAFTSQSTHHSEACPEAPFTSQSTNRSEAPFTFQSTNRSEAPFTFQSTNRSEAPFTFQSTNRSEAPFTFQSTNRSEAPFTFQSTNRSEAPFTFQSTDHSERQSSSHSLGNNNGEMSFIPHDFFDPIPPVINSVFLENMRLKKTQFMEMLEHRLEECGNSLGAPVFHPHHPGKVGPVSKKIVSLAAEILIRVLQHSPTARGVLKDFEPKLAFIIACEDDYEPCAPLLIKILNGLGTHNE